MCKKVVLEKVHMPWITSYRENFSSIRELLLLEWDVAKKVKVLGSSQKLMGDWMVSDSFRRIPWFQALIHSLFHLYSWIFSARQCHMSHFTLSLRMVQGARSRSFWVACIVTWSEPCRTVGQKLIGSTHCSGMKPQIFSELREAVHNAWDSLPLLDITNLIDEEMWNCS